MQGVTVVGHPLVQHKLTLMRDKERSTKGFRQLLNEIGMLLCYEVTRDLALDMIDIETPLQPMKAPVLAGKKLVFAPILRAGLGMAEGMLDLVPSARVAHVGLYRDPATLDITAGLTVRFPDRQDPTTAPDTSPALDGSVPGAIAAGLDAWQAIGTDHAIVALDPCDAETVARFTAAVAAWRR